MIHYDVFSNSLKAKFIVKLVEFLDWALQILLTSNYDFSTVLIENIFGVFWTKLAYLPSNSFPEEILKNIEFKLDHIKFNERRGFFNEDATDYIWQE